MPPRPNVVGIEWAAKEVPIRWEARRQAVAIAAAERALARVVPSLGGTHKLNKPLKLRRHFRRTPSFSRPDRPEFFRPSIVLAEARVRGAPESTASRDRRTWRCQSAPRGSYLASPPALRLLVRSRRFQTGLGRTTSRRPVLVPVGRSVWIDRVRLESETHPAADRPPFP